MGYRLSAIGYRLSAIGYRPNVAIDHKQLAIKIGSAAAVRHELIADSR
jgi:hypothetical protein